MTDEQKNVACLICNSTGNVTPCAYPTEINRQQDERLRIERLRKGLFEARDAMRVMSEWVKKSDPAGHSWAERMIDRANDILNHAPEHERISLSWNGFNVHGDEKSIREVRAIIDAAQLNKALYAEIDRLKALPSTPVVEKDERAEEEPRLVGYAECRCILSQYCDGTCRPLFEKARAAPPAQTALTDRIDHIDDAGYVHWKEKK